ncbi:MAG TPA: 3-hydroxyacyl-CoA dehydrogenase family protein [Candidatus Acidoferrales bacterium]|nr:3-hydroxyacyl-CoA dehydrogenase family protein [Candidatus Acidoferrales bacterium]
MKAQDVRNVTVIGAGLMGHGIAQVFAQSGYNVSLRDIKAEFLTNAMNRMKDNLTKLSAVGLAPKGEIDAILARVTTTLDLKEAVAETDFVIEAATENIDLKKQIFKEVDELSPTRAVLATNTSGLPIIEVAHSTSRPAKVIGTHFWNPPYLLRAVEIVKGPETADETVALAHDLLTRVGKKPVVVKKDIPGQIGIRILYAMIREAISLVEKGVASPEDIDTVVKEALGTRLPVLGVLELADLSGVDLVLMVAKRLFKDLENTPTPSKLLEEMVAEGRYGIKTSKGFYNWTSESIDSIIKKRDDHLLSTLKESTRN